MLEETIYFAGGLFPTGRYADNGQPVYDFGLVHHTGEDRPYLTKNAEGLHSTAHNSSLYALCPDGASCHMVAPRAQPNAPYEVKLTLRQQEAIQKAIATNYFFA